ncbi:hypothetical protein CHMI_00547 [Cellulomonas hominis]|nr:hypothetical protein CHMI_00547 [Cellulomonas hominis]
MGDASRRSAVGSAECWGRGGCQLRAGEEHQGVPQVLAGWLRRRSHVAGAGHPVRREDHFTVRWLRPPSLNTAPTGLTPEEYFEIWVEGAIRRSGWTSQRPSSRRWASRYRSGTAVDGALRRLRGCASYFRSHGDTPAITQGLAACLRNLRCTSRLLLLTERELYTYVPAKAELLDLIVAPAFPSLYARPPRTGARGWRPSRAPAGPYDPEWCPSRRAWGRSRARRCRRRTNHAGRSSSAWRGCPTASRCWSTARGRPRNHATPAPRPTPTVRRTPSSTAPRRAHARPARARPAPARSPPAPPGPTPRRAPRSATRGRPPQRARRRPRR